ncbi:MAG: glycerophosphodiester phosphodiesterase [Candidatus Handelsmanbacteria bacterium]|nr:glycerophosphodiester phosphodiesterase [Candidatus Handelsmanbacteria bacterium]
MIHPIRIAHRGASGEGLAPENTLAAFALAIELGVDLIELDVQQTGDGRLVVIHDATLDRTTDLSGEVAEKSVAEIRRGDAGSWFAPRFHGERVPLLEEVLELARRRVLTLVEIKARHIAERVVQVIEDLGMEDQVVVQSFVPQTVRRVKLLAPALPAALLVSTLPTTPARIRVRRLAREVLEAGANAVGIWHSALTPALLEEMRQRSIGVWTWTVDDEIVMRDLVLMGVQGLITNYPDRLNEVLADLESAGDLRAPLGRRRGLPQSRWGRRRQLRKLRRRAGPET